MPNDWTRFVRRIFINAPVDEIYRCWASQEGLESWFLRKASFTEANGKLRAADTLIQKGDRFHWEWYNWDGSENGTVTEANGRDGVTFTFADGFCEVTIEDRGGNSLLSLVQYDIPTDDDSQMKIYVGCSNGWTFWMTNLKAYLEHGVLLHNRVEGSTEGYDGFEMINI